MNPFIQQMINYKINNLSVSQLMSLANQYNVDLTQEQASQILHILRRQQINIFNDQERLQLLKKIERIVGRSKAQQINNIFQSFINN
jgi:hypothetical protein